MQITIKQDELEVAVRDYVKKLGLNLPVGEIDFTAARSQGGQIVTEITLAPMEQAPAPEVTGKIHEAKADLRTVKSGKSEPEPAAEEVAASETKDLEEEEEDPVDLPEGQSIFG